MESQTPSPRNPKVEQVEILISNILRIGVGVSLSVVVLGTVLSFIRHTEYLRQPAALATLTGSGANFPHTLRELIAGIEQGRGQSIVIVGLMLLIATPVMRVAVSIFAFLYEGDRTYVVFTSVVLALLLLSFYLGAK